MRARSPALARRHEKSVLAIARQRAEAGNCERQESGSGNSRGRTKRRYRMLVIARMARHRCRRRRESSFDSVGGVETAGRAA
jgi:hypothetical protein